MAQDGISNRVELSDGTIGYTDAAGNLYVKFGYTAASDGFAILCRVCSAFRPIVARVYGEDSEIVVLYDVALAICGVGVTMTDGLQEGALVTDYTEAMCILRDTLTTILTRLEADCV